MITAGSPAHRADAFAAYEWWLGAVWEKVAARTEPGPLTVGGRARRVRAGRLQKRLG